MATSLPFSTVTVAESCEIMPQHNNADTGLYEHEARAALHRGRTAPQQGDLHQPSDQVQKVSHLSSSAA